MGLKVSPNHAICFYFHAEKFIMGDLADIKYRSLMKQCN